MHQSNKQRTVSGLDFGQCAVFYQLGLCHFLCGVRRAEEEHLACQDPKDRHIDTARLGTTQRPVHQLRRVLQAAERLSIPQEQPG
jgi:hypothetical protein